MTINDRLKKASRRKYTIKERTGRSAIDAYRSFR